MHPPSSPLGPLRKAIPKMQPRPDAKACRNTGLVAHDLCVGVSEHCAFGFGVVNVKNALRESASPCRGHIHVRLFRDAAKTDAAAIQRAVGRITPTTRYNGFWRGIYTLNRARSMSMSTGDQVHRACASHPPENLVPLRTRCDHSAFGVDLSEF